MVACCSLSAVALAPRRALAAMPGERPARKGQPKRAQPKNSSLFEDDAMGFEREEKRLAEIKAAKEAADAKKAEERADALRTGKGLFDTQSIGVEDEKDEYAAATISLFAKGEIVGVERKGDVFADSMAGEFKAIEEEERRAREAAALAKKKTA